MLAASINPPTLEEVKKLTKSNNELENKVSEKIGQKGALNTLNYWLKQAKELVENAKKYTVKHLQARIRKVKKGLYSFQSTTNVYQQSAYQSKEKDVKEMLEKLENHSQNITQPTKSGFFRPEVIIPVVLLVVVVIAGAVVIVRRKRNQVKVK